METIKCVQSKETPGNIRKKDHSGKAWTVEIYDQKKNGPFFLARKMLTPLKLLDSEAHFMTVFENTAEKKLMEGFDTYNNLFKNLPDVFYRTNKEGKIIAITDSVNRLLGYSAKEMEGKNAEDFYLNPQARSEFIETMEKEGKVEGFEAKLRRKTGASVWVLTNAHYYRDSNGAILGVEGITRDITPRKKLGQMLMACTSHDMKAPLSSMIGFASLLKKDILGEQRLDTVNFLDRIEKAGINLLEMVDDLLDFTSLQNSNIEVESIPISLNSFLLDIESLTLGNLAKKTGVKFILEKPGDGHAEKIMTDPHILKRIVLNLISNAVKFTEEGYIRLGYRLRENNQLEFYVKDTGIGIPREKQKVIFDRFGQAESEVKRLYGGHGLGLSIAKEFVELLGGNIRLDSNKGETTTFFFTIPYQPVSL